MLFNTGNMAVFHGCAMYNSPLKKKPSDQVTPLDLKEDIPCLRHILFQH